MSRGRKPKSDYPAFNWQEYFYKNIGVYLQSIILQLGKLKICGTENAEHLLKEINEIKDKSSKAGKFSHKILKEEIPFNIPSNWVWCRLGDIIELSDNLNIETHFTKNTIINYVDIEAIDNKNYKIRESKTKYVSELSSRARRVLKKGYVVYSLVRPYLNNIAIVEDELENHIGSTGFTVFNGIKVINQYLKYILLTDYVRQLYLSMLSGFNSPTITQEQFKATPIPLPPFSEQIIIVDFLNDLEKNQLKQEGSYFNKEIELSIIDLHKSQLLGAEIAVEISLQLSLLENLNQAILQEAVQGKLISQNKEDEPAIELLKRIKEEKAKSGKKEKPLPPIKQEEIPFEIPKNWVWCKMGDVGTPIIGIIFKPNQVGKVGIPVLRANNVQNGIIDYSNLILVDTIVREKQIANIGDILICVRSGSNNLIGKAAMIEKEGMSFGAFMSLYRSTLNNYIFKYIQSNIFKNQINDKKSTGINQLTQETLNNILIPLPPLSEQKRIVEEIERQLSKTKELKEHITANKVATEDLLKALLHGAFEGRDN